MWRAWRGGGPAWGSIFLHLIRYNVGIVVVVGIFLFAVPVLLVLLFGRHMSCLDWMICMNFFDLIFYTSKCISSVYFSSSIFVSSSILTCPHWCWWTYFTFINIIVDQKNNFNYRHFLLHSIFIVHVSKFQHVNHHSDIFKTPKGPKSQVPIFVLFKFIFMLSKYMYSGTKGSQESRICSPPSPTSQASPEVGPRARARWRCGRWSPRSVWLTIPERDVRRVETQGVGGAGGVV